MCCFCTAENFVQVEVWAPNKAVVGLWEFNSLSARLRRVRFPSAAPNKRDTDDIRMALFAFNAVSETLTSPDLTMPRMEFATVRKPVVPKLNS